MNDGVDVSFIVLTHHRDALLRACLESIYAQRGVPEPYEVIVIDNGGGALIPPAPVAAVHLHVEHSPHNLGVAGGRNRGIALARGRWLIFIDDDACFSHADCAHRMIALFDQQPSCAAVAVRALSANGEPCHDGLPHPNKRYLRAANVPTPVPHYLGVCHALRAEAVKCVGGYPERFFYGMEELDLSLRLIDAGYRILYDPEVTARHQRADVGRVLFGADHWRAHALNKCRVAWRSLPLIHILTTCAVWSIALFFKTLRLHPLLALWRDLWAERALLVRERAPIQPVTVRYLRSIGARLWF